MFQGNLAEHEKAQWLNSEGKKNVKAVPSIANRARDLKKPIVAKRTKMVGTAGFEPATTTPPVWCADRLRHAAKASG